MSAQQTKFMTREVAALISETKMGDFGCFMANAVKCGFSPLDVAGGICSNFAATLLLFVDSLPEHQRANVCVAITEDVRDFTVRHLNSLADANAIAGETPSSREAPSPAAAK